MTVANTVDVREMLCAQALQVIAQATRAVPVGSELEIVCNAPDVYHDVLVWAKDQGHAAVGMEARADDTRLWIRRGR